MSTIFLTVVLICSWSTTYAVTEPPSTNPTTMKASNSTMETMTAQAELNLWTFLPRDWSSVCNVDYNGDPEVDATIRCRIKAVDHMQWRLQDLRSSLAPLEETRGLEVGVDLRCETGGNISLPWPMRAPGMVKLTVRNCRILDRYSDYLTPSMDLGDWLRELDLQDSVWVNHPRDMEFVLNHLANMTSHYECGQDSTLVVSISRNVSEENSLDEAVSSVINQDLLADSSWTSMNLSAEGVNEEFLNLLVNLDKVNAPCFFENLQVQDESFTPITSKEHFEFMVRQARYPKLRLLNFTFIGMTEVPLELRQWRRKFPDSRLGVIDLSRNYISSLGEIRPFSSNGVPTTFILRRNNFTDLSYALFRSWSDVPDLRVDIRENPFNCDCRMTPLVRDLRNQSLWLSTVAVAMPYYRRQLDVLTCAQPRELRGRSIGGLVEEDLPCPRHHTDLKPAMAGLGVMVAVLLLLLVLAVRYRKEVRILMYTRVHVTLPCGLPMSGLSCPEKLYDAFVAYAHQDSDWVLGSLLPRLELPGGSGGCPPSKLCIHQRDFVVGKPIIDNIIDSIASSRHTIIVLSKSFVKSTWAMEELRHAHRQSLEERRRHLVVVVLEEVDQQDMAPILRRCCKTFTYLHASDTLFWDRLLYSLHVATDSAKKDKSTSDNNDEYDDISHGSPSPDPEKGGVDAGEVSEEMLDAMFRRAVFLETMRTTSVDSATSTLSDTALPTTPSQFQADRPLFTPHS